MNTLRLIFCILFLATLCLSPRSLVAVLQQY